ncbi:hypothetical protein FNJ84_02560 [Paracoccus sp. M683]|uniref:hypothetical protein n=1 Tax=Paracoccus sp. M683 TaxID=2594268 RepID=UPI00117D8325|nr:hypothetical protein [Paracoccus sp. M683]TRW99577.1 hypothetical protein FNJ84_02560 [Paracoccus sp. M683]
MRETLGRMILQAGATVLLASPVLAETRQALVIADRAPAQEAGQPGRDALAVSRALLAAGFDVRRLENPSGLPDAPVEAPDVMLIYLSADLVQQDGRQMAVLSSGPVDLAELAGRYPAKAQAMLLAESCPVTPSPADDAAQNGESALLPVDAPGGGMIARSPGGVDDCTAAPRLTTVLLSALEQPGSEISDSLAGAGLPVVTGAGWAGFQAQAATINPSSGGTLILDQPLRPINPTTVVVASARPGPTSAAGRVVGAGGVQILPVAANVEPLGGDRQARPTQAGLPEPSIIVGERVTEDAPAAGDDSLQGTAVGTDFEERRRIREQDPQLFASLLESGAFDPPADQMAGAIQTELQRMNCYKSQVDGLWGNGSRQAVDRYFQQAGGSASSREADITLFRQIALRDDVRCPDPVVQPAARNPVVAPQRERPRPSTPRQPQQPARPAPPAPPPPAAASGGGLDPSALGAGIFR